MSVSPDVFGSDTFEVYLNLNTGPLSSLDALVDQLQLGLIERDIKGNLGLPMTATRKHLPSGPFPPASPAVFRRGGLRVESQNHAFLAVEDHPSTLSSLIYRPVSNPTFIIS